MKILIQSIDCISNFKFIYWIVTEYSFCIYQLFRLFCWGIFNGVKILKIYTKPWKRKCKINLELLQIWLNHFTPIVLKDFLIIIIASLMRIRGFIHHPNNLKSMSFIWKEKQISISFLFLFCNVIRFFSLFFLQCLQLIVTFFLILNFRRSVKFSVVENPELFLN